MWKEESICKSLRQYVSKKNFYFLLSDYYIYFYYTYPVDKLEAVLFLPPKEFLHTYIKSINLRL